MQLHQTCAKKYCLSFKSYSIKCKLNRSTLVLPVHEQLPSSSSAAHASGQEWLCPGQLLDLHPRPRIFKLIIVILAIPSNMIFDVYCLALKTLHKAGVSSTFYGHIFCIKVF